jgi:hypothetical protein
MILETFFLMEEKRAMRTLFFQDLFCEQGSCLEYGDMTATRSLSQMKGASSARYEFKISGFPKF